MVSDIETFEKERKSLVENLRNCGILRSQSIIRAMLRVRREEYLPPEEREYAYVDSPLPIGCRKNDKCASHGLNHE